MRPAHPHASHWPSTRYPPCPCRLPLACVPPPTLTRRRQIVLGLSQLEKARCGFFEWDDYQSSSGLIGERNVASIGQCGVRTSQDCFKVRVHVVQEHNFVTVESFSAVNQGTGVMESTCLLCCYHTSLLIACLNGSTSSKKKSTNYKFNFCCFNFLLESKGSAITRWCSQVTIYPCIDGNMY